MGWKVLENAEVNKSLRGLVDTNNGMFKSQAQADYLFGTCTKAAKSDDVPFAIEEALGLPENWRFDASCSIGLIRVRLEPEEKPAVRTLYFRFWALDRQGIVARFLAQKASGVTAWTVTEEWKRPQ